jgi:hypothetical protein
MEVVSPDILSDVAGFSPLISCFALILGLLLWLLGWRNHRFWIVLVGTVTAGMVGLFSGTAHPSQQVIAGLLLAVAAGVMALTLVRLIAFAAGGLAACIAAHALVPQWQQPLLPFLAGGLSGLLLFRFWTMILTSATGTLLLVYSSLCLLNTFAKVDVVSLAERRTTVMNALCGGLTLLGLVGQLLLDRRRGQRRSPQKTQKAESPPPSPPPPRRWWKPVEQLYRRAG